MPRDVRRVSKSILWIAACGCWLTAAPSSSYSQSQPPPGSPAPLDQPPNGPALQPPIAGAPATNAGVDQADAQNGVTDLTRGPVHQGFAEAVGLTPQPTPPVPSAPPQPIDEQPPDVGPDNPDAEWLPGYWSWDNDQRGFIWVSGTWRVAPPGFRWVPGYWTAAETGAQWVPGFWSPTTVQEVSYLPAPPPYRDEGVDPASPPAPDVFWVPGYWSYVDGNYAWQPGYWSRTIEGWVWVAAHYVWTPNGYVFVDGYWDHPLDQRGILFAPVAFSGPVYQQPGFVFTPDIAIDPAVLVENLFVAPAYDCYFFGDYYGAQYANLGIYPWFSVGTGSYLYDPIFAYQNSILVRRNPHWRDDFRRRYDRLVRSPADRPPRTWRDFQRFTREGRRFGTGNRPFAFPVHEGLRGNRFGERFTRLSETQRRNWREGGNAWRSLANQRSQFERRMPERGLSPARNPRMPIERPLGERPRRPSETRPFPGENRPGQPGLGVRPGQPGERIPGSAGTGRPGMGRPEAGRPEMRPGERRGPQSTFNEPRVGGQRPGLAGVSPAPGRNTFRLPPSQPRTFQQAAGAAPGRPGGQRPGVGEGPQLRMRPNFEQRGAGGNVGGPAPRRTVPQGRPQRVTPQPPMPRAPETGRGAPAAPQRRPEQRR